MAKIKLLRIQTPGASPSTSQIDFGELCVHIADGKIFFKKINGETEEIVALEPNSQVSIGSLNDIDITTVTPTNGQVLVYNSTTEKFEPGNAAGGGGGSATDLTYTSSTRVIGSSTGDDATLPEVAAGGDSGLMTGADKTKIDGIEAGATGDQTASEIRTLVDAASDSNVFTDADHTKLDGIESGATADQTAAEIRTLVDSATDSNVFTDADHSKLDGIAAGAEVNVSTNLSYTASSRELASSTGTNVTLPEVSAGSDSGLMTGADKTKLDGIETGATADQTKADIDALNINADQLDGQHGSYYQDASNLNAGTIPGARISDIGDSQARIITLDNLEKSDLTADGQLSFDSSQGLLLYRTQQGVSGNAVTVLDGANVQAGDHISISNLGSGTSSTGRITFSVDDGAGSGLNADQVDGLHASSFLRSDANDSTTGTITAPKIDTPEIENAGGIVVDANGAGADITLSAADHVILQSGTEEAGNIYFRGNGNAGSYRFAKSGQTGIEGFLSFESLSADRTYTFPNSGGTIALTSSTVTNADKVDNLHASSFLRADANDTATGTITFNGVVNIRSALDLADNDILRLGSGDDAELFCNGSHLYLDLNGGIGNFYIRDGTTTRYTFNDNGSFTATGTISGTFNTTNVRTAIAAGTAGQVGTYALLVLFSNSSSRSPNYTVGSSNLYYSNSGANAGSNKPSGSWRLMGRIASASGDQQEDESSVWLRYA